VLPTWASTLHMILLYLVQRLMITSCYSHDSLLPFLMTDYITRKSYHWFEIHSTEHKVVLLSKGWTQYKLCWNQQVVILDDHSMIKEVTGTNTLTWVLFLKIYFSCFFIPNRSPFQGLPPSLFIKPWF